MVASSIFKGDMNTAEYSIHGISKNTWPELYKPKKWDGTRRMVAIFGTLPGSTFSGKVDNDELNQAVRDDVLRSGGYGTPPEGLPADIECAAAEPTSEAFLTYVNAAYERELDALDKRIVEATAKKINLAKQKEETQAWASQKAIMLNQWAKVHEQLNFDAIWEDGRKMFQNAYKAQRQMSLIGKPFPPGVPSCENAIRSMAAMAWFFENYDNLDDNPSPETPKESDTSEAQLSV
jgi:hypothetical protein